MRPQYLSENSFDDVVSRRVHGDASEISLKPEVNSERARLMVEAGEEKQILDKLSFFKLLSIEDTAIVDYLSEQLNGSLRSVCLDEGHVKVVYEGNESLIHSGTVSLT